MNLRIFYKCFGAVILFLHVCISAFGAGGAINPADTEDSTVAQAAAASMGQGAAVADEPGGDAKKSKETDSAAGATVIAGETVNAFDAAKKKTAKEIAVEYDVKHVEEAKELKKGLHGVLKFINENISSGLANFLKKDVFGVQLILIFAAVLVVAFVFVVQRVVLSLIFGLIAKNSEKLQKSDSRALFLKLEKPIGWAIIIWGAHLALMYVIKSPELQVPIGRVAKLLFILVFFWGVDILSRFIFSVIESRIRIKYAATVSLLEFCRQIVTFSLVIICALTLLISQGFETAPLLASLGIGGAALAFASKDTIANFFGSVSLIIDRPFVVGDWIQTLGTEGIVEAIGLRSTRIRTFPKSVVTIPNNVLANANIENWTKRFKRRGEITVGLTYSTTPAQMEQIVADFKEILLKHPKTEHEGFRVNFTTFNSSSLDIKLVFYVLEVDANPYTDVMEQINLSIMRAVEARGLSMAFPSTSVYMENTGGATKDFGGEFLKNEDKQSQ